MRGLPTALHGVFSWVWQKLDDPFKQDEWLGAQVSNISQVQTRRRSRKVIAYNFLLTVSLLSLGLFSANQKVPTVVTLASPTRADFQKLHAQASSPSPDITSLTCPCSQTTIQHESLYDVVSLPIGMCREPTAYSTCQNNAACQQFGEGVLLGYYGGIDSLCKAAATIESATKTRFLSRTLSSPSVLPEDIYNDMTQSAQRELADSVIASMQSFDLLSGAKDDIVRPAMLAQATTPAPSPNYDEDVMFNVYAGEDEDKLPFTGKFATPGNHGCTCFSNFKCEGQIRNVTSPTSGNTYFIPNACTRWQSIKSQNPVQFTDPGWHTEFLKSVFGGIPPEISELFSEQNGLHRTPSRACVGSECPTLQQVWFDQACLEEYNVTSSFATYFDQCNPGQCTYTRQAAKPLVDIVTQLVGLYGGLCTLFGALLGMVFPGPGSTAGESAKAKMLEIPDVDSANDPGTGSISNPAYESSTPTQSSAPSTRA